MLSGCTRDYYRQQADDDVYCAVQEKTTDPRWAIQNYTIDVDPRSRYLMATIPTANRCHLTIHLRTSSCTASMEKR